MKKIFIAAMTIALVLSTASQAFAAGWWRENENDTINVIAGNGADAFNGWWSTQTNQGNATSPHGGFSSTTNKCKTCHAVHGAQTTSFRLLRVYSGSDARGGREDECNYCHWKAAGASKYRLYAFQDLGLEIRGEHSLGSTIVPDATDPAVPNRGTFNVATDDTNGDPTLYCFSCHSVHGANTITADVAGWWTRRILRDNPGMQTGYNANNGLSLTNLKALNLQSQAATTITLTNDVGTVSIDTVAELANRSTIRMMFCGGCHTKNVNWRKNNTNGQDGSLQRGSHPINTDGTLEVGGGAGTSGTVKVSWQGVQWCASCHAAPVEYGGSATADTGGISIPGGATTANDYPGGLGDNFQASGDALNQWGNTIDFFAAAFPHQSRSNKLLFDDIRQGATLDQGITNDAYRPVANMDKVCGKCHAPGGSFDSYSEGPGKSF